MSTVPPGGLILITGANGYIASITVQEAIKRGYKVRGTVRSIEKNKWMLEHFGPNLELVEVPDLAAPNAFDEAVKGVDGVAHLASTVNFSNDTDVDSYIKPVIQGAGAYPRQIRDLKCTADITPQSTSSQPPPRSPK